MLCVATGGVESGVNVGYTTTMRRCSGDSSGTLSLLRIASMGGTSAMPLSFSTSSLQSGKVTVSTISFPSSAVREFLV